MARTSPLTLKQELQVLAAFLVPVLAVITTFCALFLFGGARG